MEIYKEIIGLIDKNWDSGNLEYKKELIPETSLKKCFKTICVKLRNEPQEIRYNLSYAEYQAFRKLQAEFLGITGDLNKKELNQNG